MYALEKIQQELGTSQNHEDNAVLRRLIEALDRGEDFPIHELYDLNFCHFQLAMELLRDWRLARHRRQGGALPHKDFLRATQAGSSPSPQQAMGRA